VVVAVVAEVVEIDANDEEHADIKPVKRRTKMSDSDATLRMITPRLNVIVKAKLPNIPRVYEDITTQDLFKELSDQCGEE
jgi:hypothetical protein